MKFEKLKEDNKPIKLTAYTGLVYWLYRCAIVWFY